jgi:hypothetical protein
MDINYLSILSPNDTPFLANPFGPPKYARKTVTERVEPWATQYDELEREHPDHFLCSECGGEVDPEFYEPTPKLLALDAQLDALKARGFREVPNPDYDPVRAEEWCARRSPLNQKKVTWGQSFAD